MIHWIKKRGITKNILNKTLLSSKIWWISKVFDISQGLMMVTKTKNLNPFLLKAESDYCDESHQALIEWCEEALDEFLSSGFCSSWKNNKKDNAAFFIHGFVDYAYGYHLAKPFQYDVEIVEDMCLDILPRKMSTNVRDFKEVASILSTFFEWCEAKKIIKDTKALRKTLKKINAEIYEAAQDPSKWGMAKSMAMDFSDLTSDLF